MGGKKEIKGSISEESMMSSNSEECVNTMGIRGFPAKCLCGSESMIYTSRTRTNPGRPFFRCRTFRQDHLFKWVEEAVFEEMEDALPKIGSIQSEIYKSKAEFEAIKVVVCELKEDVTRCKVLLKLCLGVICLIITVGVVMIIVGKAKAKGNVLSNML